MKKQKQQSKDIELGEDPKVLYKHYLAACDAIGIPYYPQLKQVLTNEDNPNRGSQIIIIRENPLNGKEADVFGSGNCRALMNAIIGKPNAMTITQSPYTAVKDIRIIHCSINDGGAAAIASLLFATARPIVNPASDESATSPPDWKLEYLELINNDISSDGALVLGRSLSVGMNTTLSTLILDFNETLRSDGAAALCKGLSTNSTLKKLSLKYCNIDKDGGKPIAEMLSFKKLGLISLDLTCNQLGGIGLGDICQGMGKNSCLKTFRFADNHLHSTVDDLRAIQSFAGVLVNHPALIAVDLLHNKIGSKGGSLLLPVVQKNKQITTLKIDAEMDDELYAQLFKVSLPARKGGKKKPKKKKK